MPCNINHLQSTPIHAHTRAWARHDKAKLLIVKGNEALQYIIILGYGGAGHPLRLCMRLYTTPSNHQTQACPLTQDMLFFCKCPTSDFRCPIHRRMSPMSKSNVPSGLSAELEKVGVTKARLAELLSVSTKTVSRMGEDITPEVRTILNALKEPDYKWLDISIKLFDGVGRGTPIKIENREGKYVLISKGWKTIEGGQDLDQGVVSEEDWKARLDYTCKHGREGWSCKECLND